MTVLLDSDNVDWSKIVKKSTSKKLDTISFILSYQYQDGSKNPLLNGQFNLSQQFLAYKNDSLKRLLNATVDVISQFDMLLALSSVVSIRPPSNKVQFLDEFQSRTLYDVLVQKYGAPQQCPAEYKKKLSD
jgi:hypothetical protein